MASREVGLLLETLAERWVNWANVVSWKSLESLILVCSSVERSLDIFLLVFQKHCVWAKVVNNKFSAVLAKHLQNPGDRQWNPDITKCQGTGKCVRYNGV